MTHLLRFSAAKAKTWSKWFLAFAFLFSATVTFHMEESHAAKQKPQARKVKKRQPRKDRNANPAGVFALYQNSLFGYGKCLPSLEESVSKILSRNGIKTENAAENERAALAKGIAQVERLLGQPIPVDYRYHYQWKNASGAWNSGLSRAGYVTVKRPPGSPKGTLTGRMMHELGHRFGHANDGENYQEYKQHMRGKKCMITTYCGKSLNEEFAEVFAAYIVNPDFLAKHCPDSFAYFKNKLFRNPEAVLASCENPNSVLEDHEEDDEEAVEESDENQIDERRDYGALPKVVPIPLPDPRRAGETTQAQTDAALKEAVEESDENQIDERGDYAALPKVVPIPLPDPRRVNEAPQVQAEGAAQAAETNAATSTTSNAQIPADEVPGVLVDSSVKKSR